MLFDFDPYTLARQLCPPVLRSTILQRILLALCTPLRYLCIMLRSFRSDIEESMTTTSHVIVLEGALNDAFGLENRQIYLTTMLDLGEVYFYRSSEDDVKYMHTRDESHPLMMLLKDGAPPGASFTVHVPNFLATSTDIEEDSYQGANLIKITNIVDMHKPVGKSYSIDIYNYE